MNFEDQNSRIDKFLEQCDDLLHNLFSIGIFNLNVGVNESEYIQYNDSRWQTFMNKINTYLQIYPNDNYKNQFNQIFLLPQIDSVTIEKMKVILNSMKDDLDIIASSSECNIIPEGGLVFLVKQIPQISNCFHSTGGNGIPVINAIYDSSEFQIWKENVKNELSKLKNMKLVTETIDLLDSFNGWRDEQTFIELNAKLNVLISNIDEYLLEMEVSLDNMNNKKIFIVHGHDTETRNKVELFVRRIGLDPVILSETASKGMTIIEKIEANCDVGFAIVLYTKCDEGRLRGTIVLKDRARQNVIFEHGYMAARLGRSNVVALVEAGVEIPGDLSGIVYISLQDSDWTQQVMREFQEANLQFDWSRA
jgi:predicted nucleotide-binding protein